MQNIVGKLDNKVYKSLPGLCIVNWGDNYPAVNQNGFSDRTLPLVKGKYVLKTTDGALPLPVNNVYGTKYDCAPMIFFRLLTRQNLSDKAKEQDPKASSVADYDYYRADLYG